MAYGEIPKIGCRTGGVCGVRGVRGQPVFPGTAGDNHGPESGIPQIAVGWASAMHAGKNSIKGRERSGPPLVPSWFKPTGTALSTCPIRDHAAVSLLQ